MTRKGWPTGLATFVCAAILLIAGPALAERRVALVIGNAAYVEAPPLANPGNDAADMRAKLTDLGFEIHGGRDLDRARLVGALQAFGRAAETADVALVFYAGHGLQVGGQNYLVPIDAKVEYEAELTLVLVPFDDVLRQLNRSPNVKIVLLDACRDNPFAKSLSRTLDSRSTDVLGRGLTVVQRVSGTYIAYATQPDAVAQDGQGRNSPFTAALLRHMAEPGVSLPDMMVEVRKSVMTATGGRQVPWDTSSLTGHFAFRPKPAATPSVVSASDDRRGADGAAWAAAESTTDPRVLEAYLRDFPGGLYAREAHRRLEELLASRSPTAASPPVTSPPATTSVGAAGSNSGAASDDPAVSSPLGKAVTAGLQNFLLKTVTDLASPSEPAKPAIDPARLARIGAATPAEIAKSPELTTDALTIGEGAFRRHCVACHGSEASNPAAGALLPRDRPWLWGGRFDDIHTSIRWGIRADDARTHESSMPAFGTDGLLKPEEIATVARHVKSFSDPTVKPSSKGKSIWSDNCAVCHGDKGEGTPELGAPALAKGTPMYGRDLDAIIAQITSPRHGSCPAWEATLGAATVKSLGVYVSSRNK